MKGFGEHTVVGHTWGGLIPRKESIQRWTSYLLLGAQTVKKPPAMRETWVRSLGREDPLEEGMATHSSILTWRIPWTEEPGGLQSMGSQRVGHDWVTDTFFHFSLWGYLPVIVAGQTQESGGKDSESVSPQLGWADKSLDQTAGPEGETPRWGWVPEWTGSLARRHLRLLSGSLSFQDPQGAHEKALKEAKLLSSHVTPGETGWVPGLQWRDGCAWDSQSSTTLELGHVWNRPGLRKPKTRPLPCQKKTELSVEEGRAYVVFSTNVCVS